MWSYVKDIFCNSKAQIDLRPTLIQAGFGPRPGSLMGLRYDQVHIQLFRHPEKPKRVTIAATITVRKKRDKTDPQERLLRVRKP